MKATNPAIFYFLALTFMVSFAASIFFFFSASNKTKEPTNPFSFGEDGQYNLFLQPHRFTEKGKKHRTLHFIFGGLMMLSGFLMFLGEN